MRKTLMTIGIAMTMTVSVLANVSVWAGDTVKVYLDGQYNPSTNYTMDTTREEFSILCEQSMVNLGFKFPEGVNTNVFEDTQNIQIAKLAGVGVLKGMTSTTFEPRGYITREQMATIISRMYDIMGVTMPRVQTFDVADKNKVAPWAYGAVQKAHEAGLIQGDGAMYNPKTIITREQSIVILSRSDDIVAKAKGVTPNTPNAPVNEIYTYNVDTKALTVKKSLVLDASKTNLPTDLARVEVEEGGHLTLVDMEASTIIVQKGATLKLTRTPVTTLQVYGGTVNADSESEITSLDVEGNSRVDAQTIETVDVKNGSSKDVVEISGNVSVINIDTKAKTIIKGELLVGTISSNSKLEILAKMDSLKVMGNAEIEMGSKSRVKDLALEDECKLIVTKNAEIHDLTINRDGRGSTIDIKSDYEIVMKVDGDVTINGKKVRRSDKVEYHDGKLTINYVEGDKAEDGDEDGDGDEYGDSNRELTIKDILGINRSATAVTNNLRFPAEIDGRPVEWITEDESVVTHEGIVTRDPVKDRAVDILAIITTNGTTKQMRFEVIVKADKRVTNNLDSELGIVLLPTVLDAQIYLPAVTAKGNVLTYEVKPKGAAVVTEEGSIYKLSPNKLNVDMPFVLRVTVTDGVSTATKDIESNISRTKEGLEGRMEDALRMLNFPVNLENKVIVPDMFSGFELEYTCDNEEAISFTKEFVGWEVKPNKTDVIQTATVTITVRSGDIEESRSYIVNVPVDPNKMTSAIQKEMTALLSANIKDINEVTGTFKLPKELSSSVKPGLKYAVKLIPNLSIDMTETETEIVLIPKSVEEDTEIEMELIIEPINNIGNPVTLSKKITIKK